MRPLVAVSLATLAFGCAVSRLSNEVRPYVGRNIHELATRLGKPTGKSETTGDPVYVWSSSTEGVLPTSPASENGNTHTMSVQYECRLEVTVDAQDIIQNYQIDGGNAGCGAFRSHLNR